MVIGIIALLIAILLPVLGRARQATRRTNCLSNERQLTMAWLMYANANKGALVGSDTIDARDWYKYDSGIHRLRPPTWVTYEGNEDGLLTLKDGMLWQYIKNEGIYKCPNDIVHYWRTYSINDFLAGSWDPANYPHAWNLAQIRHPSTTFVFIEEYDARGYNENSYATDKYPANDWIDYPAPWHDKAGMISFADGHAQVWQWGDVRTSRIRDHFEVQANNPDLRQLQAWLGFPPYPPGVIP